MLATDLATLSLDSIAIDGDTQPREEIKQLLVEEYADAIELGDEFPPVTVFHDGKIFWLADGFHRYFAQMESTK